MHIVYRNVNLSPLALFRLPLLFCDGHFANASFRKALPRYATWPRGQCFEVSKNSSMLVFQSLLSFLKHLPSPFVISLFTCPFSLPLRLSLSLPPSPLSPSLPPSLSFTYIHASFSQWHHGTAHKFIPSTCIESPVASTCDVMTSTVPICSSLLPLYAISSSDGCKLGTGYKVKLFVASQDNDLATSVRTMTGRSALVEQKPHSRHNFESFAVSSPGNTASKHGNAWNASLQSPRWQRSQRAVLLRVRLIAREKNLRRGADGERAFGALQVHRKKIHVVSFANKMVDSI